MTLTSSNMQPLVSILIRSMDRPGLMHALDSAAAQTWPNVEIVVIAACGAAHQRLPDIWKGRPLRLIFPEPDRRLLRPDAANAALEAARGEWLNFLDDDDELLPGHLTTLLAATRTHGERVVFSRTRVVDAQGRALGHVGHAGNHVQLYFHSRATTCALLFHRSLVDEGVRFDRNFAVHEDHDFQVNCATRSEFVFVDAETCVWHGQAGDSGCGFGANDDGAQRAQSVQKIRRKWDAAFRRWLSDAAAVRYTGEQYLRGGDRDAARACFEQVKHLQATSATVTASIPQPMKNEMPLVSILIRSMDQPTLERALDSAAAQTWSNLEIVVVAACGSRHRALPDTWKGRPLRLVYPQPDRTLPRPDAANACLDAARGEWLNFLDDDDELLPEHVAALLASARSLDVRVIYSRSYVLDEAGRVTHINNAPGYHVEFVYYNRTTMSATLFHRSLVVEGARFDPAFTVYDDYDFWINLAGRCAFHFVDLLTTKWHASVGKSGSGHGTNRDSAQHPEYMTRLHRKWTTLFERWWNDAETVAAAGHHFLKTADGEMARNCLRQMERLHAADERTKRLREAITTPLVSILIRSMDRGTLDRALDSAATQTWPNIEIVVVAACGLRHRALPDTWKERPLRLVYPQPDRTLSRPDAANACLDAARGEWLNFLDDDDELLPEHVATLMTAPRVATARVIYSRARVNDQNGNFRGRVGFASLPVQLYYQNRSHPAATLFHRSLVDEGTRFDPEFPVYEDHDFFINCATRSDFQFVDAVTCVWNAFIGESGAGHGVNTDEAQRAYFYEKLHRKWDAFFRPLLIQPETLLFVGQQYLRENDSAKALDYLERALMAQPGNINALNLAGMANLRSGNFNRAETLLTEALRRLPDHAGLRENLAVLRRARDAVAAQQK